MWRAWSATPSSPVERITGIDSPHRRLQILSERPIIYPLGHQTGKTTWVTKVKEIFDKAGMSFVFTPQECGGRTIEQIMVRYRDQFIQLWNSELSRQTSKRGEAGNKLQTYRLFKSWFQLEGYLSQVEMAKYHTALTRLRVSVTVFR